MDGPAAAERDPSSGGNAGLSRETTGAPGPRPPLSECRELNADGKAGARVDADGWRVDADGETASWGQKFARDVFGNRVATQGAETCDCANCGRKVNTARYAPHLEKCMRAGGGGRVIKPPAVYVAGPATSRPANWVKPPKKAANGHAARLPPPLRPVALPRPLPALVETRAVAPALPLVEELPLVEDEQLLLLGPGYGGPSWIDMNS